VKKYHILARENVRHAIAIVGHWAKAAASCREFGMLFQVDFVRL
jgi:hypothetical protein